MTDEHSYLGQPAYVSSTAMEFAADAFVRAVGWRNAEFLSANLRLTRVECDALRALHAALTRNFNVVRQEQIRVDQQRGKQL